MSSLFTDVKSFTLNPRKEYYNIDPDLKTKVADTVKAFALYIGLAILSFIPIFCLAKVLNHFFAIDMLKIRSANIKRAVNGPNTLWVVALIAPVLEETMWRLWLSFKKVHVAVSLLVVAFVIAVKANGVNLYSEPISKSYLLFLLEAIAFAGLIFTITNFKATVIKCFAEKHFKAFYYGSCMGFGLIHMINFMPFKLGIIWAYPFFTLPQIIMGCIVGYIRVKNGFVWGVILHCLVNLALSFIHP